MLGWKWRAFAHQAIANQGSVKEEGLAMARDLRGTRNKGGNVTGKDEYGCTSSTITAAQARGGSWPAQVQASPDARTAAPRITPHSRRRHARVQNLRRRHYDIATQTSDRHRVRAAFNELVRAI